MLANRTPPSCIQANIFAMSQVLQSEQDIVKEPQPEADQEA